MFSPQSISASVSGGAGAPDGEPPGAREFPGCRPIRITRDAIADFHGRIEYWDGDTETAWKVSEPTTVYHEGPGQRLAQLAARIAAGRGAPITTLGAADLLVRNDRGERRRILQADQIVYLHPAHTEPRGAAVEVGTDHLPDVILEVDHSTDVRRGKLAIYEAWGFPEVWVEVPDAPSPSRPKGRRSGLTIHRAQAGRFHPVTASVAFPGWTATEIHAALNEARLSAETSAVLTRVGRALGDAEGTVPTTTRGCAGNAARRRPRRRGRSRRTPSCRSSAPADWTSRRASTRSRRTFRRAISSPRPSRAATTRTSWPARAGAEPWAGSLRRRVQTPSGSIGRRAE